MTGTLRRIFAEPLAQFLAIGAVLAALHAALPEATAPTEAASERIVIGEARVAQLAAQFERTWRRPPTDAELAGVVDAHIREEILYRAGLSLSLGEEDPVIRRRIAQKMEFLLEPGPGEIEVSEAEVAAHLAAHPERFRRPARVAFEQILISQDGDGGSEGIDAAVAELRRRLAAGAAPGELGARTMLPPAVPMVPLPDVARMFGEDFAAALDNLPEGRWAGPVTSGFGLHLVRVGERIAPRDPPLAEVAAEVRRDLETRRREAIAKERFGDLRARFEISVPGLDRERAEGAGR